MAQGPLVHYEKKQRLRATTVNALVDAAFDAKNALTSLSLEQKRSLWPIPFKNTHTTQCPMFGVAEMVAPRIIGSELGVDVTQVGAVGGAQPELRRLYLVNGPQAISPDGTGHGCVLETANWVMYDGVASSFFSEWGVKVGSWAVWPDRYGFHPCGASTTMFGKVMLARQQALTQVLCLPPTGLTSGAPWVRDSAKDVRVYDKAFANDLQLFVKAVVNYTVDVADSNSKMALSWFAGGAVASPLKC